MNKPDWAAQQVRALLDAWDQREVIIARGLAQHNAEMDELGRQLMAQNPGELERNHQTPQPAPRPPAPPAQRPPPAPPPPERK